VKHQKTLTTAILESFLLNRAIRLHKKLKFRSNRCENQSPISIGSKSATSEASGDRVEADLELGGKIEKLRAKLLSRSSTKDTGFDSKYTTCLWKIEEVVGQCVAFLTLLEETKQCNLKHCAVA